MARELANYVTASKNVGFKKREDFPDVPKCTTNMISSMKRKKRSKVNDDSILIYNEL